MEVLEWTVSVELEWDPLTYLNGGHIANVKKSNIALITNAPVPSCYSNKQVT